MAREQENAEDLHTTFLKGRGLFEGLGGMKIAMMAGCGVPGIMAIGFSAFRAHINEMQELAFFECYFSSVNTTI